MNRHARRSEKVKSKRAQIDPRKLDEACDIQVDAKVQQVVMIAANAAGRVIVEGLWPDVQWSTDDHFARSHSSDWLFAHIKVTRLPPHLETKVPLAFASPDAIGFAVAFACQRHAPSRRVALFHEPNDDGVQVSFFERPSFGPEVDTALFAEYVPAGTVIGASGQAQ